ncbi:MBL fold metallo-hydrolase [Halogeometricum borinquense]|uniref:MBL fold metallo-hydrolase n=1 Tax=Halogeometricum borinquense TaxID=60847 RepID=A0A6C0UEL8_9EURY|nr:MBL fold metallo-hydrolase [Halogeometricum borinquense]QIB73640.1 MBL fold metallo-hydrolase [Halogeometricum borinquense]QIQ77004.1 MBL fold metallo-hydrolase [Halogeometricum borinquense]
MSLEEGSVYRLRCRGVNAYLVDDDGTITLVDAGTPWDADRMRAMLSRANVFPSEIDRVLVTHYDLDHVGTLGLLDLDPDVSIYAAEPDASFLLGDATPPLGNHKGTLQRATRPFLTAPKNEVRRVNDGDSVGGFGVYRAPGHTPGHVVYHHTDHGAAFLGDLVRESAGALSPSPWFVCYDAERNRESLRDIADRIDPFEAACVGHGEPLRTDGYGALCWAADRV